MTTIAPPLFRSPAEMNYGQPFGPSSEIPVPHHARHSINLLQVVAACLGGILLCILFKPSWFGFTRAAQDNLVCTKSMLMTGDTLTPSYYLHSSNGSYTFGIYGGLLSVMYNGSVLYSLTNNTPQSSTATDKNVASFTVNTDGSVMGYNAGGVPLWSSNTGTSVAGSQSIIGLYLDNSGSIVMVNSVCTANKNHPSCM